MFEFLKSNWKSVAFACSLALAFGLGWQVRPAQVIEKTKTVMIQGKETIKYIDRVTTITVKPDGTSTTVITDKTKIDVKETTKTDTSTSKDTKALSKYRAGAQIESKFSLTPTLQYRAVAGMRVVGPIWLDAGVGINSGTASLGLSWEF